MSKRERVLKVGDMVRPTAMWKDDPNMIPAGRIVRIEPFGKEGAIYVDGERRAFSAHVFERSNDERADK